METTPNQEPINVLCKSGGIFGMSMWTETTITPEHDDDYPLARLMLDNGFNMLCYGAINLGSFSYIARKVPSNKTKELSHEKKRYLEDQLDHLAKKHSFIGDQYYIVELHMDKDSRIPLVSVRAPIPK